VRIGVLALQGDFREHLRTLGGLGVDGTEVRVPGDLDGLDGLVLPGGESTTIGRLAEIYGVLDPLRRAIEDGLPVLGTCAGLIFLASATTGPEQPLLGALDATVERNAFGRQVDSFEADLTIAGLASPFPAVFIRAPWIIKVGGAVDVLAEVADEREPRPVFVRQDHILATSFHPELTDDDRIHGMLIDAVAGA
jgi:5'-phosphate synthase pdxT subunit